MYHLSCHILCGYSFPQFWTSPIFVGGEISNICWMSKLNIIHYIRFYHIHQIISPTISCCDILCHCWVMWTTWTSHGPMAPYGGARPRGTRLSDTSGTAKTGTRASRAASSSSRRAWKRNIQGWKGEHYLIVPLIIHEHKFISQYSIYFITDGFTIFMYIFISPNITSDAVYRLFI